MIPVVISASIFSKNERVCLQRLNELAESKHGSFKGLLLDENFLKKNTNEAKITRPIKQIQLYNWIKPSQQIDPFKIRSQAETLDSNSIILLDAKRYDAQLVSSVLHEIGQVWFHLKTWQPVFALIVDDYHAVRFARELSEIFYIQSLPSSKQIIQTDIRKMRTHIRIYRWLGLGRTSRLARFILIIMHKFKNYVRNKVT